MNYDYYYYVISYKYLALRYQPSHMQGVLQERMVLCPDKEGVEYLGTTYKS